MLIVDFQGNYKAKMAFVANKGSEGKTTLELVNNADGYSSIELTQEIKKQVLVVMDCEIIYPVQNEWMKEFSKRYEHIKKVVEEANKIVTPTYKSWQPAKQTSIWEDDKPETPKKGVMEMTEQEWLKYNEAPETKKFTLKDARVVINSLLDEDYISINTEDPIKKIRKLDSGTTSILELEEFRENFSTNLPETYDILYPQNQTYQEYSECLKQMKSLLQPYKYIRLVSIMLEEVENEIKSSKNYEIIE